jgi:ADP-ribosylglycohydrolase
MFGLTVGDALCAPLEGAPRSVGHRVASHGLEMADSGRRAAAQWTDDTALALELAESIAERGLLETCGAVGRW